MSLEEFKDWLHNAGITTPFETLSDEQKIAWREKFDRSRPQGAGTPARRNTAEQAATLLQELTIRPVFIDEVQRKLGLAIALIEGVDHHWHGVPSAQKPKQPPTLLLAGTPALGDDAISLSDHELGKIQKILIPGFSPFELRATIRMLPGMSATKISDLWLLWSFLAGVPDYYAQLWKLRKLQPLVRPFHSLDAKSLEALDDLFAIAAREYQHLQTHLPNDKARGLKILQEKGLLEAWVDLAMTKEGASQPAQQHVVASGFLRNVVIIHNGLTNKAALVGDLQGRALEQMVSELVEELNGQGVSPFPFQVTGRVKQWQVTSSQGDDGIFEFDSQLVIYDMKRRSNDFFAQGAPVKKSKKGEEKTKDTVKMHAEMQSSQEHWHFEAFLKNNVLPHVEAISKISQTAFKHVYIIALPGFMEHPEKDILARMTEATQFLGLDSKFSCHVDSLEHFEQRCIDMKVEFPIFDMDGDWPLITRPIFNKVREALYQARILEQPLLLRGTRRCGKTCCFRYLQREIPDAKHVLLAGVQ